VGYFKPDLTNRQTLTTRIALPAHSLVSKPSFASPNVAGHERFTPNTGTSSGCLPPTFFVFLIKRPHNLPIVDCIIAHASVPHRENRNSTNRLHGKRGAGNKPPATRSSPTLPLTPSRGGNPNFKSRSAAPLTQTRNSNISTLLQAGNFET
jgi:hypothetical protein